MTGTSAVATKSAVGVARAIIRAALARLAPPPLLTVSEWADAERILPETSAEPGPWRTARVPYMRGVMDAVNDPAVETIVFKKSAQVGGSEGLLNVLGYCMVHDPRPMLLVQPTIDMAEAFSKERLARTIESTPVLAARVREGRGPGLESTLRNKVFPGGFLALAGANSAASLAQRAVRLLLCDDLDRFPVELENEGDPVDLAIKRTTTFWDRKILLVSTPTVKGARIDARYEESDRRRFFVPCPRCGHWDYLTWFDPEHMSIVFERRDPDTAHLVCRACGGRVDEHERLAMIGRGQWRPTAESRIAGFAIWEAYSPWSSLREVVAKGLAARARGRHAIRVWVNATLGEAFDDDVQRAEPQGLLARAEDYGAGIEVPEGVACLTAGVDTQDDRFELLVEGWGMNEEKWVIDWRQIPGDPKHAESKAALLLALSRRYAHALGPDLPIIATCIDSGGHRTDDVYDFVLAYQHLHFHPYATIGRAGLSGKPIVGPPSDKRYGKHARPVGLRTINLDDAKATTLSDLQLTVPGPGYWHLPRGRETIDQAFVAQLTSEQKVTQKNKKTGAVYETWVKVRDANHAWDCAILNFAAFKLVNPNIPQMLERIRQASQVVAQPAPTGSAPASPPPPPAQAPGRRISRSGYLNQ